MEFGQVFSDSGRYLLAGPLPTSRPGQIPAPSCPARRRGVLTASLKPPFVKRIPVLTISAAAEIIPDPQIPNAGLWRIVRTVTSYVTGSIFTRSMAPAAARMPKRMCPPSKAGPAAVEQQISPLLFPKRISPLVPRSISRVAGLRRECGWPKRRRRHRCLQIPPLREGDRHMRRERFPASGPSLYIFSFPKDRRIGGLREIFRNHSGKEMMHGRIPYHGNLQDMDWIDSGILCRISDEAIHTIDHSGLQETGGSLSSCRRNRCG